MVPLPESAVRAYAGHTCADWNIAPGTPADLSRWPRRQSACRSRTVILTRGRGRTRSIGRDRHIPRRARAPHIPPIVPNAGYVATRNRPSQANLIPVRVPRRRFAVRRPDALPPILPWHFGKQTARSRLMSILAVPSAPAHRMACRICVPHEHSVVLHCLTPGGQLSK